VTDIIESVGGGDVRSAALYVSLLPRSERKTDQKAFEARVQPLFAAVPDARVGFSGGDFGGGGRPLTLYLTGDDPVRLEAAALRAVEAMRAVPGLRDPRINGDLARPELLVRPRLDQAAEYGVSVAAISQTIRIATLGDLPQNAAKFSLADRQVPIRVSLLESSRSDMATIENLPVRTATGGTVPLKAVAEMSFGRGPSTIRRYNQSRRVVLDAELDGVELGPVLAKVKALPALRELPDGVRLVEVGQAEFMTELFNNFLLAIAAGVLMVFAVLVLLFQRVFQPITILAALPLSVGGAVIALMLFGKAFSMPAVIGFLMLMGIVGKNSILLVDFAIEEMQAGKDRVEALVEAGHKRARPIIMTTVAMVAGMVPVAISVEEFRVPMGVAVIGGLVTSTALTLLIVPAVFTLVDDVERWFGPRFRRLLTSSQETEAVSGPRAG
jgi:multidrug efflux pump subunit AcrB